MNKKTVALICIILSSVIVFSSCSATAVQGKDLLEGFKNQDTSDDGKKGNLTEVTDDFKIAFADFSFNLFREVVENNEENELFSPLSAIICLAMVANGADGSTKTQMEEAFGMDIESLNENLYIYMSDLYSADDCVLRLADSIWFRDNEDRLKVNEDFLRTNAKWYDAQIFSEPFNDDTLKAINSWCEDQTDGMIKEIIEEIKDDNVMFLINALIFDAKWDKEVDEDDENPWLFTNYDGEGQRVQMLDAFEKTYIEGDGFKGFTKDYIGNQYSFLALLPDEEIDIYEFINTLSGSKWISIWNSREQVDIVGVKMPVFSYEIEMDLVKPLKSIGMIDLFSPAGANLSRIGESSRGNLFCSSVTQKTFIELTRKGTKAAAVTQATLSDECATIPPELQVYLDRPFVYALVDNNTGLPFFIGAVTNLEDAD